MNKLQKKFFKNKREYQKFREWYFIEYSKAYFRYMSKNRKFVDIDKIKDFIKKKIWYLSEYPIYYNSIHYSY